MPTTTVYEITQVPQGPTATSATLPVVRHVTVRSDAVGFWLTYYRQREPGHLFEVRVFTVEEEDD